MNCVLRGFLDFLENSDDKNLIECKKIYGIFFIFHSIEKWKEESEQKNIPRRELVLREFLKNKFIAPP